MSKNYSELTPFEAKVAQAYGDGFVEGRRQGAEAAHERRPYTFIIESLTYAFESLGDERFYTQEELDEEIARAYRAGADDIWASVGYPRIPIDIEESSQMYVDALDNSRKL